MSSYEQTVTEDRRLVILIVLAASDGYRCNEYLLRDMLDERGHMVSQDRIRSDLDWLEEQGLVTQKDIADCKIATITTRGLDVSTGRTKAAGVKRPKPGK